MTHLSPAAILAWKIAMFEAINAGSGYLEKEHLLIGLYSLEKAIPLQDQARDPQIARQIQEEKDALDFPLCNSGLDATTLRRNLRSVLPQDRKPGKETIVHRSPDCRTCFERAVTLANGKEVTAVHLLNAILENPGPKILSVVEETVPGVSQPGGRYVSMQMTRAIHQFQKTRENKVSILCEIDQFQHTLTTLPRESYHYARLKRELNQKTIQLALACLDLKEMSQLINSLKQLSSVCEQFNLALIGLIPQLEFMQREGIRLGDGSSEWIRNLLKKVELDPGIN